MEAEEKNNPATTVVEDGEKVSGGEKAGSQEDQDINEAAPPNQNQEATPEHDTKKEDMTGYNEHPDQEKVGGG